MELSGESAIDFVSFTGEVGDNFYIWQGSREFGVERRRAKRCQTELLVEILWREKK